MPHVLFIPKWWPNPEDPQLGDFLRKQGLAAALFTKVSVLYVHSDRGPQATGLIRILEENGLWEVHSHFPASRHRSKIWRKMVNLVRYWNAAIRGWRVVKKQRGRPDIVHVHILVRPALVALGLKYRYRIPFIISEQSSEYLDGKYAGKSRLFKQFNKFLFRQASAVVAVSAFLGDALIRLGLCSAYKVVPNIVPGLDRPLPAPGPPGHFMVVADLVDGTKNVSGVIRAVAMARGSDPRITLSIIGDGPDREMLQQLCIDYGVQDQVRFLGRLPNRDVLDRMAIAASVIVNSNVETFSVVTGEALALGKPVIATRCGGPTAFINPSNGILIDVQDDGALSTAMLRLMENPSAYSAAAIRNSVHERSSPSAVGSALMEIYTSLPPSNHA